MSTQTSYIFNSEYFIQKTACECSCVCFCGVVYIIVRDIGMCVRTSYAGNADDGGLPFERARKLCRVSRK